MAKSPRLKLYNCLLIRAVYSKIIRGETLLQLDSLCLVNNDKQ